MDYKHLKPETATYLIWCLPEQKAYVGSTKNLRTRMQRNINRLRRGDHHNKPLQRAFDTHGEEAFELEIFYGSQDLERNKVRELNANDQCYNIARYENKKHCYRRKDPSRDSRFRTIYIFRDPNGNTVETNNLYKFCREHGLNRSKYMARFLRIGKTMPGSRGLPPVDDGWTTVGTRAAW
jgi:hypothetical protein